MSSNPNEHDGSNEAIAMFALRDLIIANFNPQPLVCVYPFQYPRIEMTSFPYVVISSSYGEDRALYDYGGYVSKGEEDLFLEVVWYLADLSGMQIPSPAHAAADRKARINRRQFQQLIRNNKTFSNTLSDIGDRGSDILMSYITDYLKWEPEDRIYWGNLFTISCKILV